MSTSTTTIHPVARDLATLRDQLNARYYERNDAVLAGLLALLSAEHVFYLGPPGTAKTQMVKSIIKAIINSRSFFIQMSKTTPNEKVEGPLNVPVFRETGDYLYKRKGFATDAEFVMFDEIGKASPITGHNMLAWLNEREVHEVRGQDGEDGSYHSIPLSTAFAASNETLTDQDDNSAAFWDRLLFRTLVDYIQDDDNFLALLNGNRGPEPDVQIEWAALKDVIDNVVPAIPLNPDAQKGLASLRHEFRRNNLNPSDRRWFQSVAALKAHAFLNGRSEVIEDDLAVLRFTLWDTVEQIDKVTKLCMIAANPYVERLYQITSAIKEVDAGVAERTGTDAQGNDQTQARRQYAKEANGKLGKARDQLDALLMEASGRAIPGFKVASDEHRRVLKRTFNICLDQSDAEADNMMATRLGMGDGGNVS